MEDPTKLSVTEAAVHFRDGALKPSELTEAYLAAIESQNPELNAYLDVFADDAREAAKRADARFAEDAPRGPLDGIPLAVKDNILIAGKRATAGSKILEPYVASYDATAVARLRAAGAIFLGKTNLDEFAMGSSTENSAFGPAKNPIDPARVPGGSSGGSAVAVAADLASAALGSETGGSVRQPAAFCGVVGLKPTYGSVSRSGLIAMASSLDQIGPFGKTVEDVELLFSEISGHDPLDATTHPEPEFRRGGTRFGVAPHRVDEGNSGAGHPRNLRIGLPKEYFGEGLDDRIRKEVMRAVDSLRVQGAQVREVSLPYSPYALAVYYLVMPSEVSANLARFDGIRYGASLLRETTRRQLQHAASADAKQRENVVNFWDVYFETRRKFFGDEPKRRILVGTFALSSGYYDAYYARAQKVRALIKRDFDRVFQEVDVLVTPTSPTLPFRFGERTQDPVSMYLADIYTVSANIAGIPALSVPFGAVEDEEKLFPVGVQLMAQAFAEPLLFSVGKLLESANFS